jgi:hypothetical protein
LTTLPDPSEGIRTGNAQHTTDPVVDAVVARLYGPEKDGHEECRREIEDLKRALALVSRAGNMDNEENARLRGVLLELKTLLRESLVSGDRDELFRRIREWLIARGRY